MNPDQYLTPEEVAMLVKAGLMKFPPKGMDEARPPSGKGGGIVRWLEPTAPPEEPPSSPPPTPLTPPDIA
jgi:hypothetical protein